MNCPPGKYVKISSHDVRCSVKDEVLSQLADLRTDHDE